MKYNRWSKWWHLILLKASDETLSENTGNGCSMNCVPATGKLPCSCYCWNGLKTRGISPCRNELKICKPPLLTNPDKTQKPYKKWKTPENHQKIPPQGITLALKALCRGQMELAETLPQTLPKFSYGKRLTLYSKSRLNPLQKPRSGAPPKGTASSLPVTAQSL